ncbi:MAG TPA: TetR/AcrR family transcriptional regulator [Candidatus Eisenbergiella merdipullorum]|uniref:TetR/AcrR family transcriptional regulator n=1 Tax=Candidatus Eisenbergiella merdipullorum TaxID=2838553 RepID=A0A9D2L2I0_9FIRM|nr:TetR/AcrR family transcriptional regulator [Candidatus Eisenbergiella merdipullorum]
MPRQGLGKERIVQEAVELIEENGLAGFSMGELARSLNVKTASLYNHVESMDHLLEEVGFFSVSMLVDAESQAIAEKKGDAALFALAEALRTFAREHYQLYRVIMGFARQENRMLDKGAEKIIKPILRVLSDYGLSEEQQIHWQRVLRGIMYGFAAHEQAGGFSHYPADVDESYRIAIQCVVDGLHRAGNGGGAE